MSYNAFGPQRHFLVVQASVVITTTCIFDVAMPLVCLALDRGLQQFICAILILYFAVCRWRGIVCMFAFLLSILGFVGRLRLLDISLFYSGESHYSAHKVPNFQADSIFARLRNLGVNASQR